MKVRTRARIAAALIGAVALPLMAAPVASAQTDPYGSTTTTAPVREVTATCGLSLGQGRPGDTITATVGGVFFGETVRILFDTTVVAQTTAPLAAASTGGAVLFGGTAVAGQDDDVSTTVTLKFQVPKGADSGTHVVSAVGDTFTCFCNPEGHFKVLGDTGSSLARTGVEVGLLAAIALALLVLGRGLVTTAKARRAERSRQAGEQAERERQLVHGGR
jgi:hypothetical protein